MCTHLRIVLLSVAVYLSPALLLGQLLPGSDTSFEVEMNANVENHLTVAGKVMTLRGDPIGGAQVLVEPIGAPVGFRTLKTDLQGRFQTDYQTMARITEFSVDLTVTKKGFLKAHEIIDLGDPSKGYRIYPVTLREPGEDPRLLSQEDLISRLAPRLKNLEAAKGLSAAREKDYARGVEELLAGRPDQPCCPSPR